MPADAHPGWPETSSGRMLAVLHPAFALTGLLHGIGGPLLPSLASAFQLSDSQSGLLFLAYFAGTSLGALLCTRNYARSISLGFATSAVVCFLIPLSNGFWLHPLFLGLGISVGMAMSAVSMIAGRRFADRSAAPLTLLNFSWSLGALLAPLLAARILLAHTYRTAYVTLGVAAALAGVACWLFLEEAEEPPRRTQNIGVANVRYVALFALLTFLEVGIENTTVTWLATFVLRSSHLAAAGAAAVSSLYWFGFLVSRGFVWLLLVRMRPARVLTIFVSVALVAAALLIGSPGTTASRAFMTLLGVALAPVFPLLLATFFAGARQSSDSRWVLAFCGFGGSVLPWLTGIVSAHSGSLRVGLITVPSALLIIACMLPVLHASGSGRSLETQ